MNVNSTLMLPNKKNKQKPRYWNEEEDAQLREAIRTHGTEGYHTWKEVAKHVPNRTYRECMQRWTKVLAPGLKKGKWSAEEDNALIQLVSSQLESLGEGNGKRIVWNKVSSGFEGRSCKQCRERWINHLDPNVKKSEWTQEEDITLLQLFESMPNKWAKIARQIPGRTENMVKVRWNALNRQAKKRKQNALYYHGPNVSNTSRSELPLNYMNPVGSFPPLANQNVPPNYNQFYINNSFSLNLANQNAQNNSTTNENGENEERKNSLYLFPHTTPGQEWNTPVNLQRFPQQSNTTTNVGEKEELLNNLNLRRSSSLAQLQKMNLLPNSERRLSFTINGLNFDEPNEERENNGRRLSTFLYQDLVKNISFQQETVKKARIEDSPKQE